MSAAPAPASSRLETFGARVEGRALRVDAMPSHGFGHRSLMWWGTLGLITIEGMVFALTAVAYFYLWSHADRWPLGAQPPALLWGAVNTAILLASTLPNHLAKRAAERYELRAVRHGLVASLVFGAAFLAVRALEFAALGVRWDTSAYGSVVWMLLALHTVHLATDVYDTAVLTVLMHTGPIEDKRFVDVSENAFYWYFVVISWLPIAAVIYVAPRIL
jgi:cytochrome c oxidase subunit 3